MPGILPASGSPLRIAVVVVVAVIVPGLAYATGFTKADGGHLIVVRNGGPFDDNSIRQVIQPNSSLTSTGLFSRKHPCPSTHRHRLLGHREVRRRRWL